jgi:2-oxoisovalerate dehydrogenase E1 component
MMLSRWVDRVEMELVNRGEAFFHVGGAGHEATAALAHHLKPDDWLHLHYRDKALMLARGIPPGQFFHSLLCTSESHSEGRQMSAHLSAPDLHVLSLVGPVGNNAPQAVGVALEQVAQLKARDIPGSNNLPVVVCAMGDGTTQQGEVLEALSEAARSRLPILFLIEDNGLAISTSTRGRTFFEGPNGHASSFMGMPIERLDGRDPLACDAGFARWVNGIRSGNGPLIGVVKVERLTHHTNADDERLYRDDSVLDQARRCADPIRNLAAQLESWGVKRADLESAEREIESSVRAAAARALSTPNPIVNRDARAPWTGPTGSPVQPPAGGEPLTMLAAMREVLREALEQDSRVTLYGEDIEDPKGDVFGLTRGLSSQYPGRVVNSALAESLIVGVSIGRALAGGRPVALIQFADFLPLCFNQVASELGSMWWRSAGGWPCPVLILAPCGGYRPGLGPFHAQTWESVFAHVPGLDVLMPATAADAAGQLRTALAGGRPTLLLYPKVLLNDASVATDRVALNSWITPGSARLVRHGDAATVVTWGATVSLCERALDVLNDAGVHADLIDLRSLSPWDESAVLESVRKTGRLVVVHEDNRTCGFGAEIVATVVEQARVPVQVRRVTRPDTYIPCNYPNQLDLLPSVGRVLAALSELCGLELVELREPLPPSDAAFVLEAVGSSPADQNVTVIRWRVREGDEVRAGDLLAECEADKATFDLRAPTGGRISSLLTEGESVRVGSPMARIAQGAAKEVRIRRVPVEPRWKMQPGPAPVAEARPALQAIARTIPVVGLSGLSFVTGSRVVPNDELILRFPGRTSADIVQRTGIESRFYCAPDETVLDLAARASRAALKASGLTLADLDGILVSTSTPMAISPSLACSLHHELSKDGATRDLPASDILAACSGWLYAMQTAHDACGARPGLRYLVVSAEAMSRFINPDDFDTAIVFGDAATAAVVHGGQAALKCPLRMHRPLLSARGEDGSILNMGRISGNGCAPVEMHGVRVFPLAVRQMNLMLRDASTAAGWVMSDLDWIVPHQANGRIIAAAQQRSGVPAERVISNVSRYGNTSSSSIPIALAEMLAAGRTGKVGLAAFGGGFTFAAAAAELG